MNSFFAKINNIAIGGIKKPAAAGLLFLLLSGGLFPLAASALEWQWPAVPGVGTLEQKSDEVIIERCQQASPDNNKAKIAECVQQEKDEQLGYYLKYFLYMFFFLSGTVILILIIIAGIGYIDASGKVEKMMRAKERLNRALLGLVILVSSWALLYLINPNLLIFKAKVPVIPPYTGLASEPAEATVTMLSFSSKESIDSVLDKMMEKTSGGVYRVIEPFEKSSGIIMEALLLLKGDPYANPAKPGLQELLQNCRCGSSKSHIKRIGTLDFVVDGGIDPGEVKNYFNGIRGMPPAGQGREINSQDICFTRCDNCGTLPYDKNSSGASQGNCVLNDIRVEEGIEPDTAAYAGEKFKSIEINENNRGNWIRLAKFYPETTAHANWIEEPAAAASPAVRLRRESIKYKIIHLQYLIPQLEAMQLKFSGAELNRLGNVLSSNAMDYMLAEARGGIFQSEFEDTKNELAAKGVAIQTEEFSINEESNLSDFGGGKSRGAGAGRTFMFNDQAAPPAVLAPLAKNKFFAALSGFVAPFWNMRKVDDVLASDVILKQTEPSADRFYIVISLENTGLKILPYDEAMVQRNKLVLREASRANLYAVLADQSLEEIEKMVGNCMVSAFGQAEYNLPQDIEETIRSAVGQGSADYLVYEMAKNSSEYAALIGDEIVDKIGEKADNTLQKRCANKSCGYELPVTCADESCEKEHLAAFLAVAANKECVDECVKGNIPANFVSSKVSQFLTDDLIQFLPDEIEKVLNSQLKEVLKDSRVVSSLNERMGVLYDKVLQGALSTSFKEQVPGLKSLLNANIYGYLAKQTSGGFMQKIDGFLNFSIDKYLQERISSEVEKVAGGLSNEFEELAEGGFDFLQKKMPGYFPESIRDPLECNRTELLLQGYMWQGTQGCKKLTPETINSMKRDPNSPDGGIAVLPDSLMPGQGQGVDPRVAIDGDYQTVEMLCHKAGYVWTQNWEADITIGGYKGRETKEWQCVEDQDITTDLKGLTDVKALGKKFIGGAINFIEEFSIALTETILHTVTAYADVWIEDEVLHPLEAYITQFSGFQDDLKKFLKSSVDNLLPEQISQTLNGNVETTLKNICALADTEPSDPQEREALAEEEPERKSEISLYAEKTWGGSVSITGITNGQLWAVCDVSRHLNTSLSKEISSSGEVGRWLISTLNTTVKNLIPWAGLRTYLEMSPLEIIFREADIAGVKNLVNGTPVDIMCGRLIGIDASGEFGVAGIGGKVALATKCNALKTQRDISAGGHSSGIITFPDFDKDKLPNDPNINLYRFYCPFIWGACQNPFGENGSIPLVGQTVGQIIKSLLTMGCGMVDKDAKMEDPSNEDAGPRCQGSCLGLSSNTGVQALQNDPNCPGSIKNTCEQCNMLLNDSMAYFMIAAAIESDIGPASQRTNQQRADEIETYRDEIETYRWMRVYFPLWESEIQKVAVKRGLSWSDVIGDSGHDYVDNLNLDNAGDMDNGDWLKVMVAWRLGRSNGPQTVKDVLTRIPDGLIKPWRRGDATLLRPAGQTETTNILDNTPSQILGFGNVSGICKMMEESYALKYPDYTFARVQQQVRQRHPAGQLYSMESLERTTTAETLNQIADSPVPDEYKYPYLICQYLKSTPAAIFGLDQELIYYVRPQEYQILFQLIQGELAPEERPESLNSLLNYLSNYTPVGALSAAAAAMQTATPNPALSGRWWEAAGDLVANANAAAPKVQAIADIFGTTVASQLQAAFAKKADTGQEEKIIDQICASADILPAGLCDAKLAQNSSKWTNIENALLKSPVDLLVNALDYKIAIPEGFVKQVCRRPSSITKGCAVGENLDRDRGLCCKKVNSLMDAAGFFWPFLGDSYIDSLFNAAGWTDNVYSFVEEADDAEEAINKMTLTVESSVASAIDKVVLEEPAAAARFIGNKVAGLAGWSIGNNLGNTMAGRCWEITEQAPCDTTNGQVERTTAEGKNECCDMGGALVCQDKCRAKGADSSCKEKQGEKAKNGDSNVCCYENIGSNSNECYSCRELKSIGISGGEKCSREGENETPITQRSDDGRELTLCCKKRDTKELLGPAFPESNEPDKDGAHKLCCETIAECVTGKFLDHLEVMKDYLIDGLPINASSLLPK
ncbi:MAG: hypothetical protein PHU56_00390 [Candidatus Pacebacteria bacterium]|nr:hypothetical protein [Candidatus Paceibacterota bacterium]